MLKLSGDAGKIYSRIKGYFTSKCPYSELREEIEKFVPARDAEIIQERQRYVKKMIDISGRVDFQKVRMLEKVKVKKMFLSDRVFVAETHEEYQKASKLGVCQVVRERDELHFPIVLNDFVRDVSPENLAPEMFIYPLLNSIDSFRSLAELEMSATGDNRYMKILYELLELEKFYRRIEEIRNLKKMINELEDRINAEIERKLSDIKVTLTADELLKIMESREITGEIEREINSVIEEYEKQLEKFGINEPVFLRTYPVRTDRDAISKALDSLRENLSLEFYLRCLKLVERVDLNEINRKISYYRSLYLYRTLQNERFVFPEFGDGTEFINGRNLFISDPLPVSYCIGNSSFFNLSERVVVLTGANSGGKTSLLELICQIVILAHMGFPVNAETARVSVYDEVFYFKRKTSAYGSGAFERAIKNMAKAISGQGRKLILIDEFESVTEPGAGAKILSSLLKIADRKGHHVVVVSHLGQEFQEHDFLRIDGIEAKGLDERLNLVVERQPVFGRIGKSTPELIIERLREKNRGELRRIFTEILDSFRS